MINDIISIYLSKKTYKEILRDQILFQTTNMISKTIKSIIINYYDRYENNIFELTNTIKSSIIHENYQFDDSKYINIAWNITKHLREEKCLKINRKEINTKKVSLRINNNDFRLEEIIEKCPSNINLSEYLCNIIYAYLNEPQHEREKVLYKDIVDSINRAITNKENIKIYTKSGKKHFISPKEICVSQENLYNYLIYQGYDEEKQNYYASTIHIYNILNVQSQHNPLILQPEIEKYLNRMKNNGVQFSINGETIYKVQLTDEGKKLFNSRYLERPKPLPASDEKNGIYYFDCSKMQFKSYFAPFRSNVIILEPQSIIDEIVKEYEEALHNYQKSNKLKKE